MEYVSWSRRSATTDSTAFGSTYYNAVYLHFLQHSCGARSPPNSPAYLQPMASVKTTSSSKEFSVLKGPVIFMFGEDYRGGRGLQGNSVYEIAPTSLVYPGIDEHAGIEPRYPPIDNFDPGTGRLIEETMSTRVRDELDEVISSRVCLHQRLYSLAWTKMRTRKFSRKKSA